MAIEGYWIAFLVIILALMQGRRKLMLNIIKRKRNGVKRKMPTELLREFIGKNCIISLFNSVVAVQGKIVAVEENWIKVEAKKKISVINGDMITDISMAK